MSKETREIVRLSRSAWPGALRFGACAWGRYRFTGCEAGAPGRSSNETVGCRCEAREVEGARRVCDEVRSGCSEGRGRRRPAFVMSFSSLEEETIPEVAGIVSEAVMVELGARV